MSCFAPVGCVGVVDGGGGEVCLADFDFDEGVGGAADVHSEEGTGTNYFKGYFGVDGHEFVLLFLKEF